MNDRDRGARRRARAYWFSDGLPELAFGWVVLATAAVLGLAVVAGRGASGLIIALGLPLVLVVGIPLAGRWVRMAKRATTYPRSGVVRYAQRGSRQTIVHWVVALFTAAVLVWVLRRTGDAAILALVPGVALATLLVGVGLLTGLSRFILAAAAGAVALASTSGLLPNVGAVLATTFAVIGLVVLRNGWAARFRYRRDAPSPEHEP